MALCGAGNGAAATGDCSSRVFADVFQSNRDHGAVQRGAGGVVAGVGGGDDIGLVCSVFVGGAQVIVAADVYTQCSSVMMTCCGGDVIFCDWYFLFALVCYFLVIMSRTRIGLY